MKTQNEQILSALQAGACLTALDAQREYGIMRLAARINDLRAAGHPIISRRIEVRNRNGEPVKVAAYSLGAQ